MLRVRSRHPFARPVSQRATGGSRSRPETGRPWETAVTKYLRVVVDHGRGAPTFPATFPITFPERGERLVNLVNLVQT